MKINKRWHKYIMPLLIIVLICLTSFMSCVKPEPIKEVQNPPQLLSPTNGFRLGSTQQLTFSWSSVENAVSYLLRYSVAGGTTKEVEYATITSYTINPENFAAEGLIIGSDVTWTVTAKGVANQMESAPWNFEIMDDIPPQAAGLIINPIYYTINGVPVFAKTQNLQFSATITDNVAVTSTQVSILKGNGTTSIIPNLTMTPPTTGNVYTCSVTVGNEFDDNTATYTIRVVALDAEGNQSTPIETQIRLDELPPAITITVPLSTSPYVGEDPTNPEVRIVIKGSTVNYTATITDEPDNNPNKAGEPEEKITDKSNKSSNSDRLNNKDGKNKKPTRIIDPTTITSSVFDGTTDLWENADPIDITLFDFTVNGSNLSGSFQIPLNPTPSTLVTGKPYQIRVTAADTNGNSYTAIATFKLDPVPPVISNLQITNPITQIDNVPIFRNEAVTFSCQITENIPAVSGGLITSAIATLVNANGTTIAGAENVPINLTFNQLVAPNYSGGFTTDGGTFLNDGTYTLRITAQDNQGNEGSEFIMFKIDSQNPNAIVATEYVKDGNVITQLTSLKYISDSFVINGTAQDNVKVNQVYVIVERDNNITPSRTVPGTTSSIPTDSWATVGNDEYKRFVAAGQETWSAGINISDKGDGNYYFWLRVVDVVGNEYTNPDPIPFNTFGSPPDLYLAKVDTNAPSFNIYAGTGINKYADHNTLNTAWTIATLIQPQADRIYNPYGGVINQTTSYDPTNEYVHYVDWTGTDYAPDYNGLVNENTIIPIVDLDICELGGAGKEVIVEIGVDGTFESPFTVYTSGDCIIGTNYNADVGYKNDSVRGYIPELPATTARLSRDSTGASLDGTHFGTYRFNLLDFPKGSGNIIQDGSHAITFRLSDEAGNTTEKQVFVHTKMMNRPYLGWPDLDGVVTADTEFYWYHPVNIANPDDNTFADYTTSYILDLSQNSPPATQSPTNTPETFETNMVSRKMYETTGGFNFNVGGNNVYSDNLNIADDPELGTGQWYWRIRAVIEDQTGNVVYELGSDNLPFALNPLYVNFNQHALTDSNIHDLRVGNLYPPVITGPDYGCYYGTSEDIIITWDPPNGGEVTNPALIEGYIMQMRALSPQNEDGDWVNVLGSYTDTTTFTEVNVYQLAVNKAAAPINNRFGAYQYRVRTVDRQQVLPSLPISGWAYGMFVYTGDTVQLNTHLASVNTGMPFKVNDIALTDTGRLVVASPEDNRIWVFDSNGKAETSVSIGDGSYNVKIIIPVTETIQVINPVTLLPEDRNVEVFYLYAYSGGANHILKLNHEYNIVSTFTISNFNAISLPPSAINNLVGMDYYNGNLYVYIYQTSPVVEKILQINTTLGDYVEVADLTALTSYDGMTPAIATPLHFGVDSYGDFLIVDTDNGSPAKYMLTRLLSDGGFYEEFNLTDMFTVGVGSGPIVQSITSIDDMDIYLREINIAMTVRELEATEDNGRAYRLSSIGALINPSIGIGYDEAEATYNLKKVVAGVGNMYVMSKEATGTSERLYKIGKNTGSVDSVWGYGGYITGGGAWGTGFTVSLPGFMSVKENDSVDGYPLYSPTTTGDIYVVDKATQTVVKVGASQARSQRFNKLSGLVVSSRVSTTRGVYVADESENAIYHLGSTLTPREGGSFDSNGRIDPTIFHNYTPIDTSEPPDGIYDDVLVNELPLNQPKGMHLEIRQGNQGTFNEYLYIADYGNDRIVSLRLTQNGTVATKVYQDLNVNNPIDVTVFDREGLMYVLDEDGTVFVYRRQNNAFNLGFSWTVPGTNATAIDADQAGCVYVTTEHGVYKWGFDYWPYWAGNGSEKPLSSIYPATGLLFGDITAGTGDGYFNTPSGICVGMTSWDNALTGRNYGGLILYVSDTINRRIKVLTEGSIP